MNGLRDVLQAVGVWQWLQQQFLDLSEAELLAAIGGDLMELWGAWK